MIKKSVITLTVLLAVSGQCLAAHPWKLIEDTHVVESEETLSTIAEDFMKKNTYGPREIREFTEGIKELNPWLLERDCHAGDKIRINYWIKSPKE